ncbi:hypothetical protein J2W56_004089 [Nocardia kruczakiae]|uniref:DUF4913 domain-containing protein n=1 Tax=Nocardia kruczakiae TaxID=261477 RepID=A0ABU1XIG0_9NOCA|nr:DUF4913 domain-containing protein [Nocardia kruczakiae]MDR7170338.1 hypothetical protein [Nocardia kruczakiae]
MNDQTEANATYYANVGEFVESFLKDVYRRQVTDLTDTVWCPEWWKHPEAALRLDALWHAWEYLRQDGQTGMSAWFLEHADPHMSKLFDPRGPFKYCSVRNGHKDMLSPLPTNPPQRDLFADPNGAELYKR